MRSLRRYKLTSEARLWVLLMSAYLVVGVAIGYFVFHASGQQFENDTRRELLNTVRLASQFVDAEAHAKLTNPRQMHSESYRQQNARLATIQDLIPEIRYIYTLRETPTGCIFVLDPTPPGDADRDGIEDQSALMEPYEDVTPKMHEVFDHGRASVEPHPVRDRWGTFLSAYAPIIGEDGKSTALIGIDYEANEIEAHYAQLFWMAVASCAVSITLGFMATFAVVGAVSLEDRGRSAHVDRRRRVGGLASALLQLVLGGVLIASFMTGLRSFADSLQSSNERYGLENGVLGLQRLSGLLVDSLLGRKDPATGLEMAALHAEAMELPRFSARARVALNYFQTGEQPWVTEAQELMQTVATLEQSQTARLTALAHREEEHRSAYLALILVGSVTAGGSMLLIRALTRQQHELEVAARESDRLRRAFQSVVENLPVGLYQVRGKTFSLVNRQFDRDVGRGPEESAQAAFLRVLASEDQERVIRQFEQLEESPAAYQMSFRIQRPDHEVEHFESRGIPIFEREGELAHLLGFNLNTTETVRANQQLREKNAEVEATNYMLRKTLAELHDNFEAMVHGWVKAVEAKDPYTAGHSERVMSYSVRIGALVGLDRPQMRILEMGTLVHDIGKIGIPDHILLKPGQLTDEEFARVRKHPEIGCEILERIPLFQDCVPIVRWHHEKLDGSGYPDRLSGDEIPLLVRISTVADVFDAMTSARAYRGEMPVDRVLQIMRAEVAAGKMDGKIVEALAEVIHTDGVLRLGPQQVGLEAA